MPEEKSLTTNVRKDGTLSIEGVAPGSYIVRATLKAANVGSTHVTLSEQDVDDVLIVALPSA